MDRPRAQASLVVAGLAIVLVAYHVPFGRYVLYPFLLLSTWVHEMGHGLTALAVRGVFAQLEIFADGSGLAHVATAPGVPAALVSLGGLLAPPAVGATFLVLARRSFTARATLLALSLGLAVSCALLVRSVAGLVAMPAVMLLLLAVARYGDAAEAIVAVQLVALCLAFDTITSGLSYLFMDAAVVDGQRLTSDIATVAQALGGPRLLYSVLVAGLSAVLLLLGLWAGLRAPASSRPRG